MLTLTEPACEKIKEMMEKDGNPNLYLRIGVHPGGCSGFSYGMGFDDQKHEDDMELEQHGVRILVDAKSAPFLQGVEIDYKETLMGGGFTIHNPNAISTCGCGHSFRTKDAAGQPEQC
ncbi:MAG: hypothetical protein A6D91_02250 [Bacillaceae bacterium G1]|nr:iron-sulfur cluster insertion protein ErpA [Bacillota bacterium]OJF18199.1 MAG: hypothetical protein A6D91_02250 [Bacillaceae bacterium G1]